MGADFQHGLRAGNFSTAVAEARIEEAGIVGSQLAAGGFIRDHLGRMVGRHTNPLLRCENIELLRFEQQAVVAVPLDRLPEIGGGVVADFGQVDHVAVFLRAVADDAVPLIVLAAQIDPEKQPSVDP